MATGSGKTLIMAGLILYLYEKGYRNFLFFVNFTNIIEKTKDNFLNPRATKYLFSENIYFKGKRVAVIQVDNFDGISENDINICFTTIQQLHTDMTTKKENALTPENFAEKKIVLLSDEAHHMNVTTPTGPGVKTRAKNGELNDSAAVSGSFSFKQILGLSKFLDSFFQVRRGSKPRLPGLGGPKSDEKPKTIVNRKNKETLSSPGRFGFLTEPAQSVLLILNFTINSPGGSLRNY